jgi:hypothetical protein
MRQFAKAGIASDRCTSGSLTQPCGHASGQAPEKVEHTVVAVADDLDQ